MIGRQSADAFRQEAESYQKFLLQQEKRQQENAVERQIRTEERNGNREGVDAIIQREYERARDAAMTLRREYELAVAEARKDEILTEEEKRRIAELRSRLQEAMSDEEKWRNRGLDNNDRNNSNTKNTVGAWSAEMLTALLGGNQAPEEETAKNTKEMVRLAREQLKIEKKPMYW